MNRLRIVVEQTGPDTFECKYVGSNLQKANAILSEPSPNLRALFNGNLPNAKNRPTPIAVETQSQKPKKTK